MIQLYKFEKLPYTLKLRKIIKILEENEYRLNAGDLSNEEFDYLKRILELLKKENHIPTEIIRNALNTESHNLIRPLNTIRHFLITKIGRTVADWDFIDGDGELDIQKRRIFWGMNVYLEDIRAPFNVGAMFRTAESFGVEKIFLSPFCADPNHSRAEKTARGCVSIIPWERISESIDSLGIPVFALETGGVKLSEFSFPHKGIMIVGSEELGVSPKLLELADSSLGRVSIPTYGAKGSLNASVAFGIAIQAWATALLKS